MKNYFLILSITILFGCSNNHSTNYIGTYTSIKPGYIETIKYYVFGYNYIIKDSLILNVDSTFELTTCGNILNGKYKLSADSIFLFATRNRFRIDSLNKWNYTKTTTDSIRQLTIPYIRYKVDGDQLVSVTKRKKLKGKVFNILEKIK